MKTPPNSSSGQNPEKQPKPGARTKSELHPNCHAMPELLRLLRKLKKWTLADLAAAAGVDASHLFRSEKSKAYNPTLHVLSRVADAYKLELADVMEKLRRLLKL